MLISRRLTWLWKFCLTNSLILWRNSRKMLVMRMYGKENSTFECGPGGGGTSLWVRRGCAPVLGSFWPENSGIGVSFYWKISVIGVYFHSEFSGVGDYSKFCNGCWMKVQLDKFSSYTLSVSSELISSIFVLKNVLRSEPRSNGHLEPK